MAKTLALGKIKILPRGERAVAPAQSEPAPATVAPASAPRRVPRLGQRLRGRRD